MNMHIHAQEPRLTAGAPLGEGRGVVILLHGRNAGPQNILGLVPALARPAWTYMAPAAAGGTWYPYSFLTEISKNEPFLSSALQVITDIVDDLTRRSIPRRHIVLAGFSQGACLISEWTARRGEPLGGVIAFSGGLIGPPGTTWPEQGQLDGTPIFLGCSDVDSHIPRERVEETAAFFERRGADVTMRLYAGMGHTINEDEFLHARAVLDRASPPVPASH
jgi:predicted esterase